MRTTILALVLLLMSNLAVAVEPGVYYCVTERMAGIQAEWDAKDGENIYEIPRFEGSIQPNKEKFIVKIHPVDSAEREARCAVPRAHMYLHRALGGLKLEHRNNWRIPWVSGHSKPEHQPPMFHFETARFPQYSAVCSMFRFDPGGCRRVDTCRRHL